MTPEKYKTCAICKQCLPVSSFSRKGNTDWYQSYCKTCQKTYRKNHYEKNKQDYYSRNKRTRYRIRDYVLKIKSVSCCTDCGSSYPSEPWLMEFDHLGSKLYAISECPTIKLLKEEIKKCEIVCVLCHRRRTAKRAGWEPNRYAAFISGSSALMV